MYIFLNFALFFLIVKKAISYHLLAIAAFLETGKNENKVSVISNQCSGPHEVTLPHHYMCESFICIIEDLFGGMEILKKMYGFLRIDITIALVNY
jgi:hypothetical protein